jgi:hypothetical protein
MQQEPNHRRSAATGEEAAALGEVATRLDAAANVVAARLVGTLPDDCPPTDVLLENLVKVLDRGARTARWAAGQEQTA